MARTKKNEGFRNSSNGIARKNQLFVKISENLNVMTAVRPHFVKCAGPLLSPLRASSYRKCYDHSEILRNF